jgi:hypothetical protein
MSIEHPGKPPIYWVAAPPEGKPDKLPRERHEIPENAVICVWNKKKRCYMEVWIDSKTGNVRVEEGGP